MPRLKWFFAPSEYGADHGYRDAGIETFRDTLLSSIARETIQNSLDAGKGTKTVKVDFQLRAFAVSRIPDAATLRDALKRSKDYWSHDSRAVEFFTGADELLSEKKIPALEVSDFNTTGLQGDDEQRESDWYSLIRCYGASAKHSGQGGSFGIGSSAPFAASRLRTILYSTATGRSKSAFIGVARLVTHVGADGTKVSPDGYLGVDGTGRRVSTPSDIPRTFSRREQGTTLTILGFDGGENWEDELKLSVIENFWPAIYDDKLHVTVGEHEISHKNIEQLAEWAHSTFDSDVIEYIRCLNDENSFYIDETLPNLGDVVLYLRTSDTKLPKAVAMIRKTGMVVYAKKFQSTVPFCGAFFCQNDDGNAILREMEPPRHDRWSPDLPDKGKNKKIEREFLEFIRAQVRALNEDDERESDDIPDLGRFLPDQLDEDGNRTRTDDAGPDDSGDEVEIPTSPIGTRPPKPTTDDPGGLGVCLRIQADLVFSRIML